MTPMNRNPQARYAPGTMPVGSTRGDAMTVRSPFTTAMPGAQVAAPIPPTAVTAIRGIPARGTRLSPGIYADGKGGSYRKS